MRREGQGSENSEHVVVRAHLIVVHKQLTAKAFVIEVVGEIAHRPFKVVALVDDVAGEVFLAVVLSDVAVLEMFEFFAAPVDEGVHSVRRILVAHVAANQRDGSFGLLWTNPDVDVLSFESFFVSLHCWNGFGG